MPKIVKFVGGGGG